MKINQKLINSLKAEYGFDAEEELTNLLRDEIDREILDNLISLGNSKDLKLSLDEKIEYYDNKYRINKDSLIFSSIAINALRQLIELGIERIKKKHCE